MPPACPIAGFIGREPQQSPPVPGGIALGLRGFLFCRARLLRRRLAGRYILRLRSPFGCSGNTPILILPMRASPFRPCACLHLHIGAKPAYRVPLRAGAVIRQIDFGLLNRCTVFRLVRCFSLPQNPAPIVFACSGSLALYGIGPAVRFAGRFYLAPISRSAGRLGLSGFWGETELRFLQRSLNAAKQQIACL